MKNNIIKLLKISIYVTLIVGTIQLINKGIKPSIAATIIDTGSDIGNPINPPPDSNDSSPLDDTDFLDPNDPSPIDDVDIDLTPDPPDPVGDSGVPPIITDPPDLPYLPPVHPPIPIPEPLTILGAATAIAFGTSFKRKLTKAKKK